MFIRDSNVVFANILSFHVRESTWNGAQMFFIIWPKVSSNIQITKLLEKNLAPKYFQNAQSFFGKYEKFLQPLWGAINHSAKKKSQNAKKFQALRFF